MILVIRVPVNSSRSCFTLQVESGLVDFFRYVPPHELCDDGSDDGWWWWRMDIPMLVCLFTFVSSWKTSWATWTTRSLVFSSGKEGVSLNSNHSLLKYCSWTSIATSCSLNLSVNVDNREFSTLFSSRNASFSLFWSVYTDYWKRPLLFLKK